MSARRKPRVTPRSLTRRQAAEYTGLSYDTIRKAVDAGELRVFRPRIDGREVMIDLILVEDLEAWAFPGLEKREGAK